MREKLRRYPLWLIIALALAVILFLFSAVGGARAALTIFSDDYVTEFSMYHIGITLNENEKPLAWRNYSNESWTVNGDAKLLGGISGFKYGTTYDEKLSVTNSGSIDEYVRVTVYKYWTDENGNKRTDLDPNLIKLNFLLDNGWVLDKAYSTDPERTVLYYTKALGTGETTPFFTDTVTVDGSIKNYVTQTEEKNEDTGYTVVTNHYLYDGKEFCIEVQADGVQTHNAEDAILSAWGRKVTVSDGTLTLG